VTTEEMTARNDPIALGADWRAHADQVMNAEADRRARSRKMRFDTISVHGIYDMTAALANHGSIIEPLSLATAQHFPSSDEMQAAFEYKIPAWGYARVSTPTIHYLEETLSLLETYGTAIEATSCVTSSGMAAIHMATSPFLSTEFDKEGQPANIVASTRLYGGSFMLFSRYAVERGVEVRWVADPLRVDEWASRVDAGTRFLFGEMPSNPGVAVFDIPAVAEVAHAAGVPLIVDSTVATPALLRPLALGADIVVHSLTKTIAASGFSMAGAIIARRSLVSRHGLDHLRDDFATWVKLLLARELGPTLSPFSALMVMSDLRTLRARVDDWSQTADTVSRYLVQHGKVTVVAYPGLIGHPGHEVARRDMQLVDGDASGHPVSRYGHLLSFVVRGGADAARRVFDQFELIWRATDLGRVKSVAAMPMTSTHQQQGESGRKLADIPAGMIRLSIGGEHPDDIIADLEQALDAA